VLELYPAIDLRGGKCVRLLQGDFAQETVYGDDPVAVAKGYEAAGAPWIHMVDLDGARTGEPANRDAILAVRAAVGCRMQVGGGVRDASLLDAGIDRVVMGTAAVEDPALVGRLAAGHRGRVAVGLDVRDGEVAIRGWTEGSGQRILEALGRFENVGVAAFVVTDIGRDGTLAGPDMDGLKAVLGATKVDVVASGGVGSINDLRILATLEHYGRRLSGAIVGKALYEGVFTIEEAIAACAPAG
jgi:phosphoribosylformimino-5-aminoimidazole carboxamide ribotide isomerase